MDSTDSDFFDPNDRPIGRAAEFSVNLTEDGLAIGSWLVLARMRKDLVGSPHLGVDEDKARLLTLLSVAEGRPIAEARVLPAIEAAAAYWDRGEKALANLRLVFSDLPRLRHRADEARVRLAADLLDAGMAPSDLMQALWRGVTLAPLEKYRVDQPRVPAGQTGGGQWTIGPGGVPQPSVGDHPIVVAGRQLPPGEGEKEYEERHRTGLTTPEEDAAAGHAIDPMAPLPPGIGPGPFAGRSIPAGPTPRPMPWQQKEVTVIGNETGCHSCGTKDPGTPNGNFYCDHQPPTALSSPEDTQVYLPHCRSCSGAQGSLIRNYLRNQR